MQAVGRVTGARWPRAAAITATAASLLLLGCGGGSGRRAAAAPAGVVTSRPPAGPRAAEAVPAVSPHAFDPAAIGAGSSPRRSLHTLLVTGDSMSEPMDTYLAEKLVTKGVHVIEDPHLGTGISNPTRLNWGRLAAAQVVEHHPDAIVIFIGAAEGFPMPDAEGHMVECCGAAWGAIYANRVRDMANTYRQKGAARVYWITLPTPREADRQRIERVVNAAIAVGVQPWADQVRVIDTVPVFTPGERYRDAMAIGGTQTIVRRSDGIHLNEPGSQLLANLVAARIAGDYTY